MDDLTGKQLGPYKIVAPLGEGGMAAVYKAFQPSVNRYVALKVLPQYFARDPQFAARFEREAQLLAQLQHPNILPVFDFGRAEDPSLPGGAFTYIAMPLVQGGSLEALMRSRRMDYAAIRRVMNQLGDALDYAHSRNLIHRDIKPANVLLDERGNCLLTDFGLARMVEGSDRLTSSGVVMGTPAYMSPEQGQGRAADRRTDIYSLGVILYEMALGRPPFEGDTPMVVMVKHINEPLPLPSTLVPSFPPALEQVLVKVLAKDPAERYPTAGAFVTALNAALDQAGSTQPVVSSAAPSVVAAGGRTGTKPLPPEPEKVTTRLLRNAWWAGPLAGLAALAALAVIVIAGVLVFNLLPKPAAPTPFLVYTAGAPTPSAIVVSSPTAGGATQAARPTALPGTAAPTAGVFTPTGSAGGDLVTEDFESGQLGDWTALTGTAKVAALPDGNHAVELTTGESGGATLIYSPSFGFAQQNLLFQADVMAPEVKADHTSVRLNLRLPAPQASEACLGYAGALGAGWTVLDRILVDGNDCDKGAWQETELAPYASGEIKPGEWQHLKVIILDNSLQFYVNDTLVASGEDVARAWGSGGLGVSVYEAAKVYVDNVRVQAWNGPLPGTTSAQNWYVVFGKDFPPNTWGAGDNSYGMSLRCGGTPAADRDVTQSFTTSAGDPAPSAGDVVYVTDNGPFDSLVDGSPVASFNPAYTVRAAYLLGPLNRGQVVLALRSCKVSMDWSANGSEPLPPMMVYQH